MLNNVTKLSNDDVISSKQIQKWFNDLCGVGIFAKPLSALFTDLISKSAEQDKIHTLKPYDLYWQTGDDFPPSIVLSGLLTVHYPQDPAPNNAIYNILQKGHLFGKFEMVKFSSRASKIYALTDVVVMSLDLSDFNKITEQHMTECKTYLIQSLSSKLYSKNIIIEILHTSMVVRRLCYLLDQFRKDWKEFTSEASHKFSSYRVNVFWSDAMLESILNTKHSELRPVLSELVSNDILQIDRYELDETSGVLKHTGTLTPNYILSCKKREDTWIQFTVLKSQKLQEASISTKPSKGVKKPTEKPQNSTFI